MPTNDRTSHLGLFNLCLSPLLISCVSLLLISDGLAADLSIGRITDLRGTVTIRRPGVEKPDLAVRGTVFSAGDVLETGAYSFAQATFQDDFFVQLAPDSSIRVNQYSYDEKEQRRTAMIREFRGLARFVAYKSIRNSRLRVETAQALTTTGPFADFVIGVSSCETEVAVLDRSVTLRNASALIIGELNLGVNQRAVVKEKAPPGAPELITPGQRKIYLNTFRRR